MLFHDLDQAGQGTYHQVTGSFERIAMLIKLGLSLGADIPPSIDSEDEHEIGLQ